LPYYIDGSSSVHFPSARWKIVAIAECRLKQYGEGYMNHLRFVRILVAMLVCMVSAQGVRAQHVETRLENAEVVYVEGNDLVVKLANGEVKQFEITEGSRFTIDGKDVTVHELTPGMKLTATITTAAPPRWVDTVEVFEVGTVWKNVGNSLIIKTSEGENRMYRVPAGCKITVGGIDKTLDQLREGDKITATVVKTRLPMATGNATAFVPRAPRTPARVGVLLIDEGALPGEVAKSGEPAGMWGTSAITLLLVVVLLLVTVLIVRALRRKRKV
jgi:hypothetical protein